MNISQFFRCKVIFTRELSRRTLPTYNVYNSGKSFNIRNFHAETPKFSKFSTSSSDKIRLRSTRNYFTALGVLTLGAAYAAVPLYRIFCQASGFGGTTQHDLGGEKIEGMQRKPYRKILVKFVSDVSTNLMWEFQPQQKEIEVIPGETALAFYTAKNPLDTPVIGISTYNVLPYEAGQYFNKIQCFCFEEQQLNPKEQVDMPVFFYIDPEFCEDPMMEYIDEIILSYTFFQAKSGINLGGLFSKSSNNK